jgi:hypothetical protein
MADKPQPPPFVFVDNSSERMIILRRTIDPHTQESTMVGRGLNYVRADYVDANRDAMGGLGLRVVDPTTYAEGEVAEVLRRGTSRQAFSEWGKREKRAAVISKIKARLNGAQPEPQPTDADGSAGWG